MKSYALLFAVSCLLPALPASLPAQTLKADIPFNFVLDGKTMPAGQYTFDRTDIAPVGVILRSADGRTGAIATGQRIDDTYMTDAVTPRITFERVGDEYFLSDIWAGPGYSGIQIDTSGARKEAARERAAAKPETVVIVAVATASR